MGKKVTLKVLAGIIAAVLMLALFFVASSFWGNPISAHMAGKKAATYLSDHYSHLDLQIKGVNYNFKDGSYSITVSSGTSVDTHFFLSYRDEKIFRDGYQDSVLSGMNTMERFRDEYKKSLAPLVQAKTNDVKNIAVVPEKLTRYDVALDSPFDRSLVKDVKVIVNSTGGTDAEHLSAVLKTTYDVMKENGYTATAFTITGEKETFLTELMNIKPAHIESENFAGILQEALANSEYDGIIAFSKTAK